MPARSTTESLGRRVPQGLREVSPLRQRRRLPWWWAAIAAVVLLAGAGGWVLLDRPSDLADVQLAGPRSPVPRDVVILLDESGSFAPYASVREAMIRQLVDWAPKNLRPDDTVTVISFAGGAAVRLAPTPVSELASAGFNANASFAMDGTNIQPALTIAGKADSRRPRALIVVTDTQVMDADRAMIEGFIVDLNATTLSTVLPRGEHVTDGWQQAFDWGDTFWADPDQADQVSLALGDALAHATGQRVERVRG